MHSDVLCSNADRAQLTRCFSNNCMIFHPWNFEAAQQSFELWFVTIRVYILGLSHFLYYNKNRNCKRYPFANVNSFWHLDGAISIETKRTWNLGTNQFIIYKSVLIEGSVSNWQTVFQIKCQKVYHICKYTYIYLFQFQLLSW